MKKYKIVVLLIAFALLLGATFLVAAENFGNSVKASEMGEIDYPYPSGDGIVKWSQRNGWKSIFTTKI